MVSEVSFSTVFFNIYIILILSSNGSSDISSRPLLLRITAMVIPGVFCHQNFMDGRYINVVIHSLYLSLPPSPLR
jgi:hypothetical protein